jgi:hypothetical protein
MRLISETAEISGLLAPLIGANVLFSVLLTRAFFSGLAQNAKQFAFETALVITCGFLHTPMYSGVFVLKLPLARVCGTCSTHFQIK